MLQYAMHYNHFIAATQMSNNSNSISIDLVHRLNFCMNLEEEMTLSRCGYLSLSKCSKSFRSSLFFSWSMTTFCFSITRLVGMSASPVWKEKAINRPTDQSINQSIYEDLSVSLWIRVLISESILLFMNCLDRTALISSIQSLLPISITICKVRQCSHATTRAISVITHNKMHWWTELYQRLIPEGAILFH